MGNFIHDGFMFARGWDGGRGGWSVGESFVGYWIAPLLGGFIHR